MKGERKMAKQTAHEQALLLILRRWLVMGRTKTSRYRNWRKQMRKRGQRPPRKRYTWDYMSPRRLVAYADPEPAEQQKKARG